MTLPLLADPQQAIWLVPTEAFKRRSHAERDTSAWRFETSDPERVYRHHVERDLRLAEHYRRALREHGLPWLEVDGSLRVDELVDAVAARFARWL